MEFERAGRLADWRQFRSGSYEAWVAKHEPIYKSFGCRMPACDAAAPIRVWRNTVFHPVWQWAWADLEEVTLLADSQRELNLLRVENSCWNQWKDDLARLRQGYQPPPCPWRLYRALPLIDHFSEVIAGQSSGGSSAYPYPDYSRACFVTMKNLTLQEMAASAIALKRYQLRHETLPASLNALVPEFLTKTPRDLMDGQSLRYRSLGKASFLLYSVGEDGLDDGGDGRPDPVDADSPKSPWTGRDWVWPLTLETERALRSGRE